MVEPSRQTRKLVSLLTVPQLRLTVVVPEQTGALTVKFDGSVQSGGVLEALH